MQGNGVRGCPTFDDPHRQGDTRNGRAGRYAAIGDIEGDEGPPSIGSQLSTGFSHK